MGLYFLIFLTSFLVAFICTPPLIRVSLRKNLTDTPGDLRKLHTRSTPTLGGVMIFAGTIFAYCLLLPSIIDYLRSDGEIKIVISDSSYLLASILLLFFIGIKDDIIGTAAIFKLLGHIIVGMILVLMGNIRITGFHGLFGMYTLPYWGSVFLSIFTYVVIINAFNFIDGIDGLAAGVGFIGAASFGVWFGFAHSYMLAALAFALCGSLLGFLIYNFSPAKIFMGDSGSLIIGLILCVLGIKVIEFDPAQLPQTLVGISRPLLVMSILAYPLVDALRIVILRSLKGSSPLEADRNHIHHALLDMKLNHRQISIILYLYTIAVIASAVLLKSMDSTWAFVLVGGMALLTLQIPLIIRARKRKNKTGIVKEMERHQAI
ncbi:MAG TPA: MraY family glycosyltransferase [Bacteroidia bacterium]|nr:MraY family glycosyltransferase [Bacteroidia bacterium]